ncbi:hypothetical protein OGAPHI_001847 [Ogataea philodendri]|uniref:Uncharacterized protein n=1 Tax=Ogataea philodendri TaxID=1378263 RepID=A0A9P8P9A5_9ASCO|nr:uncharacterized protein OGAPHI_001847 [Ogataea philodendri]KAH3668093.1 hypothetical protein OGAPHI_001847 [Ogataea philodendri]
MLNHWCSGSPKNLARQYELLDEPIGLKSLEKITTIGGRTRLVLPDKKRRLFEFRCSKLGSHQFSRGIDKLHSLITRRFGIGLSMFPDKKTSMASIPRMSIEYSVAELVSTSWAIISPKNLRYGCFLILLSSFSNFCLIRFEKVVSSIRYLLGTFITCLLFSFP